MVVWLQPKTLAKFQTKENKLNNAAPLLHPKSSPIKL